VARDYYEVLDVERDADDKVLKKSFRKLALKFHPDRNPDDPEAEAKFKEASEAYDVLSDPQKRQIYDQYGHEGLRQGGASPGFHDVEDIFSQFGDLFGDLFGGGRSRGRRGGPRRGASLEYGMRLDFMDAINGVKKDIEVPKNATCETCTGSGAKPGSKPTTCGTCNGVGEVIQQQMFLRIRTTCPRCAGKGKVITEPCGSCGGRGRTRITEKLSVTIPPGVDTGMQLRLAGKGEAGDSGAPAGDLFVTVQVQAHEFFKRDGYDVYCTVPISYPQACLGTQLKVPTVYGEADLSVPRSTPSGKVFTLRGEGITSVSGRGRGDQHIQVVVEVPKSLSPEEEELLRRLATHQDGKVAGKGFWRDFLDKITS